MSLPGLGSLVGVPDVGGLPPLNLDFSARSGTGPVNVGGLTVGAKAANNTILVVGLVVLGGLFLLSQQKRRRR